MTRLIVLMGLLIGSFQAAAFDQTHAAWDVLLKAHVTAAENKAASQLDYAAIKKDQPALAAYTSQLSAVTPSEFATFDRQQQMAFLINAYNAFTVVLILQRYPDLKSIKDIGSLLSSPWKKAFINLLGATMSLDQIEDRLREPGRFDDPRIHFAVNCASVGCPMLREESYVDARLDAQLGDAMRRFLSDRKRNRYNVQTRRLEISHIFDWYSKDFSQGHQGFTSVPQTLAKFADLLADAPADRQGIRAGKTAVEFLDYDWGLNDLRR